MGHQKLLFTQFLFYMRFNKDQLKAHKDFMLALCMKREGLYLSEHNRKFLLKYDYIDPDVLMPFSYKLDDIKKYSLSPRIKVKKEKIKIFKEATRSYWKRFLHGTNFKNMFLRRDSIIKTKRCLATDITCI